MASNFWKSILLKAGIGIAFGEKPKDVLLEATVIVAEKSLSELVASDKDNAIRRIAVDLLAVETMLLLKQDDKALEKIQALNTDIGSALKG
jgi:hypothetical protein